MNKPREFYREYYELFNAHNEIRLILGDQVFENKKLLLNLNKIYNYIHKVTDSYVANYIEIIKEEGYDFQNYLLNESNLFEEKEGYLIKSAFLISVLYSLDDYEIQLENESLVVINLVEGLIFKFQNILDPCRLRGIPVYLEKIIVFISDMDDIPKSLIPSISQICNIIVEEQDPLNTYLDHILKSLEVLLQINTEDAKDVVKELCKSNVERIRTAAQNTLKYFN